MTSDPKRFRRILIVMLALAAAAVSGAQSLVFSDGLTYNDFFAVTVHPTEGDPFTLFDAAAYDGENPPWPDSSGSFGTLPASSPEQMSYFFWVRRMGATGSVTYPLSFSRIREIRFLGPYGGTADRPPVAGLLTVDGDSETRDVLIREDDRRFSGWFAPAEPEPSVPFYTPAVLVLTSTDEEGNNLEQRVYVKTDGFLGGIDEEFGTYAMLWLRHDGVDRLEFHHDGRYVRCPLCGSIFFDDRHEVCPFDGTELIPQQ